MAAVVGGVYYFNEHQASAPAQLKAYHTCIKDNKNRWVLRWGTPIFRLLSKRLPQTFQHQVTPTPLSQPSNQVQYIETILGWRLSF